MIGLIHIAEGYPSPHTLCGLDASGRFMIGKYVNDPDYKYCETCALLNLGAEEKRSMYITREKCEYAEKYKAERQPKCGCRVCWDKWLAKHGAKEKGEE